MHYVSYELHKHYANTKKLYRFTCKVQDYREGRILSKILSKKGYKNIKIEEKKGVFLRFLERFGL